MCLFVVAGHLCCLCFTYVEEAPHMREVVIAETMMDMDKNKDGFVELDEYVGMFVDK